MILQVKQKIELSREIDKKDKFFIVRIKLNDSWIGEAGWIEKKFVKEDFIKNFPLKNFNKIEVMNYIEFTEKKNYDQYKLDNDLP